MTQETRLRVESNPTRGWQANKKTHLCVASGIRAMPETEKPPAMRVDIYSKETGGGAGAADKTIWW